MLDFLRQLWTGVVDAWRRLSVSARVNIGLSVAATVAFILFIVISATRHEYVVLFQGIPAAEIEPIQGILDTAGIPYKMADGYTTIKVPEREVGRANIAVRSENLPTSETMPSKGWSLLDEGGPFDSPEKRQQDERRAIMGVLESNLRTLEFVSSATAYIYHAPESLLKADQKPSRATVTLGLKREVSQEEIDSIIGMVLAYGGENLTRENIMVNTTDGKVLAAPPRDATTLVATTKQDAIKRWETERERKVRELIEETGRKAIVKISAKVNFDQTTKRTSEVGKGAPLSVAETTSTLTTRESLPEGAPGEMANLPTGAGPTRTETVEETTDEVTNHELTRTETTVHQDPGDVEAYRVSVILDGDYVDAVDENGQPTGQKEFKPLEDEALASWTKLVANAVGTVVTADDVAVTCQALQPDLVAVIPETLGEFGTARIGDFARQWGGNLAKALLVVGLFWYVRRKVLRMLAPVEEEEEAVVILEPEGPTPEEMRKRQIAEEVEMLCQQQPDTVASLLRAWMTESEE